MSIIYVLIPIAMLFVSIAVMVFFWAVKSNQYDDLDREGINILFDEDPLQTEIEHHKNTDITPSNGKKGESEDAGQ
ncbi:cbb3-type cytochrome oxidase assembly protein CcoS [Psychromonas antarctica]|jgi:cbb3-type cytochrome oxidase maturation protein|uniref:cbb3-type cytochrome oxidase assembly protein CcoS n=1 Tax=Psychromonas antarctica TaxID=67573 RepID=UPI001EE9A6FE|nr:cbb3-type cytochrome oxidase assembly protein CcoS [Psychromonas antarctica]MCG6201352.1 cbb3-type cytochrome oxidase assembly protein CcoS [Psychromonas antarctica]